MRPFLSAEADTSYVVSVRAFNNAGFSMPVFSTVRTSKPLAGVDSPPSRPGAGETTQSPTSAQDREPVTELSPLGKLDGKTEVNQGSFYWFSTTEKDETSNRKAGEDTQTEEVGSEPGEIPEFAELETGNTTNSVEASFNFTLT